MKSTMLHPCLVFGHTYHDGICIHCDARKADGWFRALFHRPYGLGDQMKTYKLVRDHDQDWSWSAETESFFICAKGLNALVNLPRDLTALEVTFYDKNPKDQDALHLKLITDAEDSNHGRYNAYIDGLPMEIHDWLYRVLLRDVQAEVWVVFHYYG